MSTLNSLFDVIRGWPDTSTIEQDFKQHSTVPSNAPLVEGDVCFQQSDGTLARATASDWGTAATTSAPALATALSTDKQFWLVVSGATAQNFDGLQHGNVSGALGYIPWKVVAIRGTYMFETEEFVAGSYTPGTNVTVIGGKLESLATKAGYRPYAEVRAYDSARGVLTVTV
jgi:hypothetical protein